MKKLVLILIMITATFIWYGFEDKGLKEITGSETGAELPPTNLTGVDLTGANLTGVRLDGVILCNTTMPDGTINNSSCKN